MSVPAASEADRLAVRPESLALARQIADNLAKRLIVRIDREDLYRAAEYGLLCAARRYDPELGVSFRLFASPRIRGAILDWVRDADWRPRRMLHDFQSQGGPREV